MTLPEELPHGPPGLVAPNLPSQPWLCSAPAQQLSPLPKAGLTGNPDGARSVRFPLPCSTCHPGHGKDESRGWGGDLVQTRHCMQNSAHQAHQAGQTQLDGCPSPRGSTAALVTKARVAGCWVGRSLLDFTSKNIYLLPREGTMRLMDLSGFDVPPGDTRERGSKAGTLPVLFLPVLWLDMALSPVPVSMSQLKQIF